MHKKLLSADISANRTLAIGEFQFTCSELCEFHNSVDIELLAASSAKRHSESCRLLFCFRFLPHHPPLLPSHISWPAFNSSRLGSMVSFSTDMTMSKRCTRWSSLLLPPLSTALSQRSVRTGLDEIGHLHRLHGKEASKAAG